MTDIETMRKDLNKYCFEHRNNCNKCPLREYRKTNCTFGNYDDEHIERAYNIIKQTTEKTIEKTIENINHPERYKCGKYECIDVMTDIFGVDAVKSFCKLNAFKYLWREEKKNGVEDLKKAEWYLNKLIELSEVEKHSD